MFSPCSTLERHKETPIFISVDHGRCGRINRNATFGGLWPWMYGLGSCTVVILKIQGGHKILRSSVKTFINWLDNKIPPWEAYHEFMSSGLVVLDKYPGIFQVGLGETWRRLFSKCVLRFTVPESTSACQDYKVCPGIKAVIDGAVHRVQYI